MDLEMFGLGYGFGSAFLNSLDPTSSRAVQIWINPIQIQSIYWIWIGFGLGFLNGYGYGFGFKIK